MSEACHALTHWTGFCLRPMRHSTSYCDNVLAYVGVAVWSLRWSVTTRRGLVKSWLMTVACTYNVPRGRRPVWLMRRPARRCRCRPRTQWRCRLVDSWPAPVAARCRAACPPRCTAVDRSWSGVPPSASRRPAPGCRTPCRRSWPPRRRWRAGLAGPEWSWANLQHQQSR